MEPKAEDYYDMPIELLPSANFAGRPMSDISMLDGLWIVVVPSSEESKSDDERPAIPRRNPSRPLQAEDLRPDDPVSLTITAKKSSNNEEAQRPDYDGRTMTRPRLRKKANTMPRGAPRPVGLIPPPEPRRAISMRLVRQTVEAEKSLPKAPSRHRRASSVTLARSNTIGGRSEKANSPPRGSLPLLPCQSSNLSLVGSRKISSLLSSFSQKARVKTTLKRKQMGTLKTDFGNTERPAALSSSSSMLSTPRELYAISEQQSTQAAPSTLCSHKHGLVRSFPKGTASSGAQFLEQARASWHCEKGVETIGLAELRNVYLPGAIRFEQHPAMPRRDSVATLDPFDIPGHKAHRLSDILAQDSIVMFFEDFDLTDAVPEMTLDRYWLNESPSPYKKITSRKQSLTSVQELTPISPQVTYSSCESKFSFSSASSAGSGAPKRGRARLAKLLSPALPGSAFFTPALLGKHAKKR